MFLDTYLLIIYVKIIIIHTQYVRRVYNKKDDAGTFYYLNRHAEFSTDKSSSAIDNIHFRRITVMYLFCKCYFNLL